MSDSEQRRVLLVEDDDGSAEKYIDWLRADGRQVERAAAADEARRIAVSFRPDVIILDLQIPTSAGRTDEDVEHGLSVLRDLVKADPFRPVVVATAHSRNTSLMRSVMQVNRGGGFIFKEDPDLRRALVKAIAVALESPAYLTRQKVQAFEVLVGKNPPEEEIRAFLAKNWRAIVGPKYTACHSPYEIDRGLKVDLMFERPDGFPDLWELKRPNQKIFKPYNDRRHLSDDCAKAVGQLMEYIDRAEKLSKEPGSYEARKGVRVWMHRPRGIVVIGRDGDEGEKDRLALENSFYAGISILTYDDLLRGARDLLAYLREHRNGVE